MSIKLNVKDIREISLSEDGDFLEFVFDENGSGGQKDSSSSERLHSELYPAGLWVHKSFTITIKPEHVIIS